VDGAHLRVTDLASKNGTFVEEARVVATATVALGGRVRFGTLNFLTAGQEEGTEEPCSSLETENPPPARPVWGRNTGPEQLSVAQQRVFRLVMEGLSEKRIAAQLRISPCTVHNHVTAIYRAYGVHSRAELLVRALSWKPAP
jgi:DNA-binding NarL/FixJ family response regulator